MPSQDTIALFHDKASQFKARQHIDEHEWDVYIVTPLPNYDSTATTVPGLTLTRILPPPRVRSKPLTAIDLPESGGAEAVVVNRFELTEVSRVNYTDEDFKDLLYFLIVPIGTLEDRLNADGYEVVINDVIAGKYTRHRLLGSTDMQEDQWRIMIEEMK